MRCGYCSWLGGSRAVLFKNTLRASPTLARMPYRWASAHQKGCAESMLATSPVFRGFSINFSPDGHGLSCLSARRGAWWAVRIAHSTPDPYLNTPSEQDAPGVSRSYAF